MAEYAQAIYRHNLINEPTCGEIYMLRHETFPSPLVRRASELTELEHARDFGRPELTYEIGFPDAASAVKGDDQSIPTVGAADLIQHRQCAEPASTPESRKLTHALPPLLKNPLATRMSLPHSVHGGSADLDDVEQARGIRAMTPLDRFLYRRSHERSFRRNIDRDYLPPVTGFEFGLIPVCIDPSADVGNRLRIRTT